MADTKTVFESRKFRVEQRRVAFNGVPHTFDIVVHPGAAVVLPLLEDGRVVLIENHRIAVGAELLELPAGTLDGAEPPERCAARELAEETGYRAGRITRLLDFFSSPGILTERLHAFVARELTPGAAALETGEEIRVHPLPLDEALDAIGTGRIRDAKTIVTLLYFERFRRAEGHA